MPVVDSERALAFGRKHEFVGVPGPLALPEPGA
jgi:hypothetical protein